MYTNWAHHYSIMKNREYGDALTRRFADCLKKYSTAKNHRRSLCGAANT